jgi:hypothetical protein
MLHSPQEAAMVKIVTVTLIAIILSAWLPTAPASAADVCFQDQFGRRYGVWVSGVFGQAFEIFVTLSNLAPGAGTVFLNGGAYVTPSGKVVAHLRSVAFGQTWTLDPPSFNSGIGTQFVNDIPNTALTITPAACVTALP